ARANDRDNLSGLYFEIDVAQNLTSAFFVVIREVDRVEANAILERRKSDGGRFVFDVVLHFHEVEDRRGGAQRLLEVVVELRKLANGVVKLENSDDEGEECAFSHKAGANAISSYQKQ